MTEAVAAIVATIAAAANVPERLLLYTTSKVPVRISRARWMVWRELRRLGMSYPEIGLATGGFDHASVMYGLRKLGDTPVPTEQPISFWAGWTRQRMRVAALAAKGAGL